MEARKKIFREALDKVCLEKDYSLKDVTILLEADEEESEILFQAADSVRKEIFGDGIYLRGIIEFSNYCRKNCFYCGIRAANKINRYRMSLEEILETAAKIKNAGIETVVLQSGEDIWWNAERLVKLIKMIREDLGLTVTLSIGERDRDEYALFRKAGAQRFLLKIETTNEKIFQELHPDDQLDRRMSCSKTLKKLGYTNGSGCIIGLPGQTAQDIAKDILWFRDMEMEMLGIGPLVPTKNTPLENYLPGSVFMTLKAVAVTRLICTKAFLPTTTALETVSNDGQLKALQVGANVIMPNFTPQKYKKDYKIYSNKKAIELKNTFRTIEKAGRFVLASHAW